MNQQAKAIPAETAETIDNRIIEFVPFGTEDKIKLSIEVVKRLICVPTRSGKRCSDDDAIKFMFMCQARRLNPFEGDAFLIGYDGQQGPTFSLITAHQAFLKRAEVNPEFDGMDSGAIVMRNGEMLDLIGDFHLPEDIILGGWATVYFKGRKYPMRKRLRLSRFDKGFGVWKDDKAGMIVKCAEADALRSSFPTMLGGMYIEQEATVKGEAEISAPVFAETVNGNGKKDEPEPPTEKPSPDPNPPPPAAAAEPPKKKPSAASSASTAGASQSEPKKKLQESSGSTDSRGQSTSTRKLKARAPAIKRLPQHEALAAKLAHGGFGPSDMIKVAFDNRWITSDETTWEKLPEERCAEFMDPENWSVIMELLERTRAL